MCIRRIKKKMRSKIETQSAWSSRLGVILAVAGAAVGLGNFLRFPGQAAQFGGGAFMVAYFISLIILGLPMAWLEWVLGRHGGQRGFSSPPGILHAAWNHPMAKYIGAACVVTLLVLYTYYSYVEAWCLGYAVNIFTGNIDFSSMESSKDFWGTFVGIHADGAGMKFSLKHIGPWILITYIINITLIYRGVSKGIEQYVKFAVPTLLVIAVIVLIRVLTLGTPDANLPENNISNGLGFMWNPTKVHLQENVDGNWTHKREIIGVPPSVDNKVTRLQEVSFFQQLKKPALWLAAASQVFFSLAVGFGAIMVYASYTKKDDDLVLSSLTAVSANEFAEVCLGGLITLPAAYAFLGAAGVVGQGIFQLGFNILPLVFAKMQYGFLFGGLFFFLLFIASISGVLCQLQSGIAFFEETLDLPRKKAVILTMLVTSLGCLLVFWFSKDLKVMDTLDFWIGTFMLFFLSMINVIIFGWAFGPQKIFEELHRGAVIKIPNFFKFVIKFLCPAFLISIFILWIALNVFGLGNAGVDYHILDLIGSANASASPVAWLAIGNILILLLFFFLLVSRVQKYK